MEQGINAAADLENGEIIEIEEPIPEMITRDEAALMFSNSNIFLNMFLKKFNIDPDRDGLFDRKAILRSKGDRRYLNLEMDFVEFRSQARTASEVYGKSFIDHGEAVQRLMRKLEFNIGEAAAVAAISKLQTYRRNGSKLYYLGDVYQTAFEMILAAPPVEAPITRPKKGRK